MAGFVSPTMWQGELEELTLYLDFRMPDVIFVLLSNRI